MHKYGDKNKLRLTGFERETIILYNDADKTGTVYTCNTAMIRKMDKLTEQFPDTFRLKC